MKKTSSGFTLVELMITVAIIGILAAFSIPAYQRYIARAQVSESIIMLEGARLVVDEYVMQSGIFPNSLDDLEVLGVTSSGKYISTVTATQLVDAEGELVATFRDTNISRDLRGRTVQFSRNASGVWTCAPGQTDPIESKYLPAACH